MFKCAFCTETAGVKRVKTETDSEWDPFSPSRKEVIDSVATPQSGGNPPSFDSQATVYESQVSAATSRRSAGSSVLTTPKFAGQTSPAVVLDYSPTRATGKELEDRKKGVFKRTKPGDDDDAY